MKTIETLEDAMGHLELEEDRLEAAKPSIDVYMAGLGSHGGSIRKSEYKGGSQSNKRKGEVHQSKKSKQNQHSKVKRNKKKNIAKVRCYNCNKCGHFVRDCTEPKKVPNYEYVSKLCVSGFVFLTESHPLWIVDLGAIDHITKDREAFMVFRQVPHGAKWVFMGNNTKVEVKGINTCKLVM